jgi:large subunit ribosomal protein L24
VKLKKGDNIIVTAGKDKGKKGKIEKIFPKEDKVGIPGVNMYKRHMKAKSQSEPASIIDLVKPLNVANVALICPKCQSQTRIGYSIHNKEKTRICLKCKAQL